jgi:tetratricopeptide (TPR) repeat protein
MSKPLLICALLFLSVKSTFAQPGVSAPSVRPSPIPAELERDCYEDDNEKIAARPKPIIAACSKILEMQLITPEERYDAISTRGTARYFQREFRAAIADYTSAIGIIPGMPQVWTYRAAAYAALAEFALARKDLDMALSIDPDHPTYLHSSCINYAALYQIQPALRDCNRSLSMQPGNPDVLDSRGFAYFRAGQYELALKDYNAALAKKPDIAEALYVRGVIKRKAGDLAGGNADMQAAAKIRPDIMEYFAPYGLTQAN